MISYICQPVFTERINRLNGHASKASSGPFRSAICSAHIYSYGINYARERRKPWVDFLILGSDLRCNLRLFLHHLQLNENTMSLLADLSIYEGVLVMTYEQLLKEAKQKQEGVLKAKKNSNQLAIVLYTSGSTGVPKGDIFALTR